MLNHRKLVKLLERDLVANEELIKKLRRESRQTKKELKEILRKENKEQQ